MTNYQMAWWPANYVAKEAVDNGEIGKVWRLHGIVGHGGPGSEGPRNKYFFEWLTDPEKNGAGALMDFGCYNALWSLWYLGRPTSRLRPVDHLRPERFPRSRTMRTWYLNVSKWRRSVSKVAGICRGAIRIWNYSAGAAAVKAAASIWSTKKWSFGRARTRPMSLEASA